MDKQKEIEETQRLLDKYFKLYGYIQPPEVLELVANDLYEHNVRKIPEGAVGFISTEKQYAILTKEEYKTYLAMKSIETNLIEIEKDKARTETAEKFSERLKKMLEEREYKTGCSAHMMCTETAKKCVDEIVKEIMEGKDGISSKDC